MTTTQLAPALPARLVGQGQRSINRVAFVTDPDLGDVRVRWQLGGESPWRCDACGRLDAADCAHTFAAGLLLAEQLLGLTRVPELDRSA